ncbi:MAG: protein kinase [Deltaproteobacteria bacterium]|nr:protein kinase [Deltaproteobacteria bacterium]
MTAEARIGTTLDGCYHLRREIARGGMCVVLEAEQVFTGRVVAIKALNDQHVGRESSKQRLLREAKLLELCRHPNVVEILHAAVDPAGSPYLVMEMLEGRTLAGFLTARQRLPFDDTMSLARQLSRALTHAHARGIVHRDVKPANILIVRDATGAETVKLIDFGIAAVTGSAARPGEPKITKLGEIIGTAEYMAPEQFLMSDEVDHRCDVYALAVLVFECLSGAVPYPGDFGDVILQVTTAPIPSIRAKCPELSAELDAVLQRGMARDREARFPDVAALAGALAALGGQAACTSLLGPSPASLRPRADAASREQITATQTPDFKQRRRFARQPFVTPIRMVTSAGVTYDGRSEDISEGGMLVLIDRACEGTQPAELKFAMPMSGRIVKVQVTTRWVKGSRGKAAAGLEFNALPEDLRKEIAEYTAVMGKTGSA